MSVRDWFGRTKIGKFFSMPFEWFKGHEASDGAYVSSYFTAVKILSENMSKMTPQVKDESNKLLVDHNLNKLFSHHPNSYQNRQKFWYLLETQRCDRGDAFVYIERGSDGRAKSFHIINKDSVKSAVIKNGVLYYEVDFSYSPLAPQKGDVDVRSEDMLHFTFGQKIGLFGTSALDVVGQYTDIMSRAGSMINSFYENNATSAMAIETTIQSQATAKRLEEATDTFIDKYTGVENAYKPIRLPPNTKLVPLAQKFVDAQVVDTQKQAREEIANLFGIPKYMFESTDNNESIEQQTRGFLAFTITPIIEMYVAELEYKLLTSQEVNKGVHIEYNTEKLIETDLKTKTDVITMQVSKGLMTPNEGAVAMGNDPIESEWGNVHYIQTQNQPLELYEVWGNNQINDQKNESKSDKLEGDSDTEE